MFPWTDNEIVKMVYNQDNYKVIYTGSKSHKAIVFFSGNGIYYPNTEDEFRKQIIQNDRYEWVNISKSKRIREYYSVIILVRDIWKQWYVNGINSKYDSVEKVVEFIKQLTKGYVVTTCGNSAGGYMATLVGCSIGAERIFSLSTQFYIKDVENGPLIEQNINNREKSIWMDISRMFADYDGVFYFYPVKSDYDIVQFERVKDTGFYIFGLDEEQHDLNIRGICYVYLLTTNNEKLLDLNKKWKGQMINKTRFFSELMPKWVLLSYEIAFIIKSYGKKMMRMVF